LHAAAAAAGGDDFLVFLLRFSFKSLISAVHCWTCVAARLMAEIAELLGATSARAGRGGATEPQHGPVKNWLTAFVA